MPIVLPTALTVLTAADVKALLLPALAAGGPLELDGRAVAEVDAAGLQLLVAAGRSARAGGGAARFVPGGHSHALREALAAGGLGAGEDGWLVEEDG
ncbi:MAG: STAS domain-containing protein [Anaeromyxobacter sp.]